MILEFLKGDYQAIINKLIVVGILWSVVLLAMIIDFYFGIKKARQIGEARSSEGYKRSVAKFNQYFAMLVFAFFFDAIVPFSYFFEFPISAIPAVSLLVTVALVFTEAKSVNEKADEKQRRKVQTSIFQVMELLEKKDDVLHEILANYKKQNNETNNTPNNNDALSDSM